ncbi:FG-GAP-like repeat-containing protein [Hamadaea sp.]|uniref:FG-GAP-like repeat-containing protein n=1 Tax=Hamadaea sp. TaxID=2024425 RepID=UPI0025BAD889|nr:FG-GAP-like repeat-containing protein [Hamadaea sp.]
MGGGILISPAPASAASGRVDIVGIAKRELGDKTRNYEVGTNCSYYGGEMFNWPACGGKSGWGGGSSAYAWCAAFAKYVWREAGVTGLSVIDGFAQSFKDYGIDRELYHSRSGGYKPQIGDAIVFDTDHSSSDAHKIDHVAIVVGVNDTDVLYIGGNQSDAVTRASKPRTDSDIDGYVEPAGVTGGSAEEERRLGHSITGDSYHDLVGRRSDGTLWLHSNNIVRDNGDPFYGSEPKKIGTGWGGYNLVVAADITGDGYTDLVGRKPDGTLWLHSNNIVRDDGDPFYGSEPKKIGTGWGGYNLIVGADVTGDGFTDLVARKSDGSLWLHSNNIIRDNGDPFYGSEPKKIGHGWGGYNLIVGADVTGDGFTDLVARKSDGSLWLHSNNIIRDNGDPFYGSEPKKIGHGWGGYNLVVAADVTGDGFTELVARESDGTLWLHSNNIVRDDGVPFYGSEPKKIGNGWGVYNLIL